MCPPFLRFRILPWDQALLICTILFDEWPFFEEVFSQHISWSVTEYLYQGRLFSYHDTHLHRLGTNYLQLPVNCPYKTRVCNYQRDGPQTFDNQSKSAIGCKDVTYALLYSSIGWRSAWMTWPVPSPLLNSMQHAGDGKREVRPKGMNARRPSILIEDWETTRAESAFRQLVFSRAVTVSFGGVARDKVLTTSAWGLDNLSC